MAEVYDLPNPGHWGRDRALHVIDLENLVGRNFSRKRAADTWMTYERGIGIQNGDRAIVVVNAKHAWEIQSVLPAYVWLLVSPLGPDAADRALKRVAVAQLNRTCFAMVIIASGDHTFTATARLARSRKLKVWLVSGRGSVARKLAACCPLRSQLRLPA